MKKKMIISMITVLFVMFAFLIVTNKSQVNAATTNENSIVINSTTDDTEFDVTGIPTGYALYLTDAEGNPYTGEVIYETTDEKGTEEHTKTPDSQGKVLISLYGNTGSAVINNIPAGIKYKVVGFRVAVTTMEYISSGDVEGTVGGGCKTATFDASIEKTSFTLKVHVNGTEDELKVPVGLTIYTPSNLPKPKNPFKYSGAKSGQMEKNDEGNYYLKTSIKNGESIVIENIPNCYYVWNTPSNIIDEINDLNNCDVTNYYNFVGYGTSGTIGNSDGICYNLERKDYKIAIEKRVEGNGIDLNKEFNLKIRGYVPALNGEGEFPVTGSYPYQLFDMIEETDPNDSSRIIRSTNLVKTDSLNFDENGYAYLKVKANQMVIIGDQRVKNDGDENMLRDYTIEYKNHTFVADTKFDITEEDGEYNLEIDSPNAFRYIVTNIRNFNGKLKLSKIVEGEDPSIDKEFSFKIKLEDGAQDLPKIYNISGAKQGTIEFDDNFEAEVKLKAGEFIDIKDLPVGAKYTITENVDESDDYTTTVENGNGIISENTEAIFTNKIETVVEPTKEPEEVKEEIEAIIEDIPEVEEKEEIEPVQTGDVSVIIFAIISISTVIFAATFAVKRRK